MYNSCQSFKLLCHYLRNRSTLDIGVLGYIGIVQHKEHSPEVLSIPPGTPCITRQLIMTYVNQFKTESLAKMFTVNIMPGECKQLP